MRVLPLTLLALLCAPLAAAGPIADVPLAEHDAGCYQYDREGYSSGYDNATSWYSYDRAYGDHCSERHEISGALVANHDELASASVVEESWQGNASYWYARSEYGSNESSWDAWGWQGSGETSGTFATVRAADITVRGWDACQDAEGAYANDAGSWSHEGYDYRYVGSYDSIDGCGRGAAVLLDYEAIAQADTFAGCQSSQYYADDYTSTDGGATESHRHAGGANEFCGERYEARAAGESVRATHGEACAYDYQQTHTWPGFGDERSQHRSSCFRGYAVESDDASVALGAGSDSTTMCMGPGWENCAYESDYFEGLRADAFGASAYVPLSGMTSLLP